MRRMRKMILKRKVSDLDNHIVPTKTATTDNSHSQKERSSCITNKEKVEDDPKKKLGE